ncbi:MAG: hypothetical protein ACRDLQ_03455 [Solirubrobacterales bacterium]
MRSRLVAIVAALTAIALPLSLGACGGEEESQADQTKARTAVHTDFDADNFSDSTKIDNRFSPLEPGMQFTYEGRSNRGGGRLPHRVIFTVTGLTKEIDGVRAVTLWDRDINAGKELEGELAFWAQDDDGNVWLLGEYPEEYDDEGNFEAAPDTWFSGIDRARAGIMMRGNPQPGTGTYRQGYAPTIGFGDVAFVQKTGQRACVPTGCYEDVLITDETNPEEPKDGHQLKYYAPRVGNIQAAPGRGGVEREILELTKFVRLSPGALEFANKEALEMEKRAYVKRKDVYGTTPPLEPIE